MAGTGGASRARAPAVRRHDVERELKQLRARAGLTDARIKATAPLLRYLAGLEAERRGRDISAVGFVVWGLQTLDERGATDPVKLGALRFAYGIDAPKLYPNQLGSCQPG
jgi:hypothetical protein